MKIWSGFVSKDPFTVKMLCGRSWYIHQNFGALLVIYWSKKVQHKKTQLMGSKKFNYIAKHLGCELRWLFNVAFLKGCTSYICIVAVRIDSRGLIKYWTDL